VLQRLAELYIERIADQPLPLFDVRTLAIAAQKFSKPLLGAFLALTVRYSALDFYDGVQSTAAEFYRSSASERLFASLAEPTGDLETLQAFCLLCLCDIAGKSWRPLCWIRPTITAIRW
jgi:hypothetical protein